MHNKIYLVDLLNDEDMPICSYYNVKDESVVIVDLDEDELDEVLVPLPTVEALAPYKIVLEDYCKDMNIPEGATKEEFLKELCLYEDFIRYRRNIADKQLEIWVDRAMQEAKSKQII